MKKVEMAELRVVEAGKNSILSEIISRFEFGKNAIDPEVGKMFKYNLSFILPFFGKLIIGCTPGDDFGFGLLTKGVYTDDAGTSTSGYYPVFKVRFELDED